MDKSLINAFGRRVRIGMVGGGINSIIGGTHILALRADGFCELVAGALSSRPEVARASAEAELIAPDRTYTDWREMAEREGAREERIDAVVIATPPQLHLPVAKAFLQRGIDVICEKPMTRDLAEAQGAGVAGPPVRPSLLPHPLLHGLPHGAAGARLDRGWRDRRRPHDRHHLRARRPRHLARTRGPEQAALALPGIIDGQGVDSRRGEFARLSDGLLPHWPRGRFRLRASRHLRRAPRGLRQCLCHAPLSGRGPGAPVEQLCRSRQRSGFFLPDHRRNRPASLERGGPRISVAEADGGAGGRLCARL